MAENTTTVSTLANSRPQHIEGERVLMFVRLTAVLNERDIVTGDKVRKTKFVNDLDSAKEQARILTSERNLGYIWMTQRYDTLNSDGTIAREEHEFQWTRRESKWLKKGVKSFTVAPEAKPEEPKADENSPF